MGKKRNNVSPRIYVFCILSFLFSLCALIVSFAALDYPIGKLVFSNEKALSILGIAFAIVSFSVTSYCTIVLSMNEKNAHKVLTDANLAKEEAYETMQSLYKDLMDMLSSLEGVLKENQKYIRLFKGRLICRSLFSTDEEKETGIGYLQQFSDKQSDVELLESVLKEAKKAKTTEIITAAKTAIDEINNRIKERTVETDKDKIENT